MADHVNFLDFHKSDETDYGIALERAIAHTQILGNPQKIICPQGEGDGPNGEYTFENAASYLTLVRDIEICGIGKPVFRRSGNMLQLYADQVATGLSPTADIPLGAYEIALDDATGIQPGDMILVSSTVTAETGWGQKATDVMEVSSVDGNTVTLNELTNFDHTVAEVTGQISVKRGVTVTLKNLRFESIDGVPRITNNYMYNSIRARLVSENCDYYNPNGGELIDAMRISECSRVVFRDLTMDNTYYGINMSFCRNVYAYNTHATNLRHAFVPGVWTSDCYFSGVRGSDNDSTIDSHPAFRVHWDNVVCWDREVPNCRSIGVKLTNCIFRQQGTYTQTYAYLGYSAGSNLNDTRWPHLFDSEIYLRNVEYLRENDPDNRTRFNCFSVQSSQRKITIDNCRLFSLAQNSDASTETYIVNSEIGRLRDVGESMIVNTVLDKDLVAPGLTGIAPMGYGKSESVHVNVVYKNWTTDDYLFTDGGGTTPMFVNCNFGTLKDFIDPDAVTWPTVPGGFSIQMFGCRLTLNENIEGADIRWFKNCIGSLGGVTFSQVATSGNNSLGYEDGTPNDGFQMRMKTAGRFSGYDTDLSADMWQLDSNGLEILNSGLIKLTQDNSYIQHSISSNQTAAGTGQGDGYPIVREITHFAAVTTSNYACVLPDAEAGMLRWIVNSDQSDDLHIFPASTDNIIPMADDEEYILSPGNAAVFICHRTNIWSVIASRPHFRVNLAASTIQDQTNATLLDFGINHSNPANDGDAVKLPGAEYGQVITVINGSNSNTLQVFPNSNDRISNGATNASVTLATNEVRTFYSISNTYWF